MDHITQGLEAVGHAAKTGDATKTGKAIQDLRALLKDAKTKSGILEKLDSELGIWQSKLSTIFKEPVGREGMVKHARHWVTSLRGGTQ